MVRYAGEQPMGGFPTNPLQTLSGMDPEGGVMSVQQREAEFAAAGLSRPMSAGGGGGRTVQDIKLLESMGVETEIMAGAIPIGPGGLLAGAGRYLPAALAGLGGLFAGAQALGLGEGEGLFGVDVFGGAPQQAAPGGVPFVGPGLREPAAEYVVKEWKRRIDSREGDYNLQFYLVKPPGRAYRIYMYSQRTRGWKSWALPRPAVIGKNMPSHRMLTRLRRNLKKHAADAKTILQVASPTAYAKQLGYRKPKEHHHH